MKKLFRILIIVGATVFSTAFAVVGAASAIGKNPAPFWGSIVDLAINPQDNLGLIGIIVLIILLLFFAFEVLKISAAAQKGAGVLNAFERMVLSGVKWMSLWLADGGGAEADVNEDEKTNRKNNDFIGDGDSFDRVQEEPCAEPLDFDEERIRICLADQEILKGAPKSIIDILVEKGKARNYPRNSIIARQGDDGNEAYFILQGEVNVVVRGERVATRAVNSCVGEMPLLDPTKRRCADLVANDDTTVLRVPRSAFESILKIARKKSPVVVNMAKVLANRLREHMKVKRTHNEKPRVFIGSSEEAVLIARSLREKLEASGVPMDVVDWSDPSVFKPSLTTIENLENLAPTCDFAIMVLSGDDRTLYRGVGQMTPRDNVVFELGMFIGKIGRKRSFFLVDEAKVPSDLAGATYISYAVKRKTPFIDSAATKIVSSIKSEGVR